MIKLTITGMTCGHCAAAVRRALSTVSGVTEVVDVSIERGEALVEGAANPALLIAAVEEEGYQARICP